MHNFETNYEKILEVLNQIERRSNFLNQIRQPKLSDKELLAVNLTAEYMGIDSEHQLFRVLPLTISHKIERSVYNRRKRRLCEVLEKIRCNISSAFNEQEKYFIIDSMPLEVCKLSRSNRSRICKENLYCSPDKGYCASQSSSYYGYKLHAICSVEGVFKSVDISPASVHDIHYLRDVKTQLKDCVLIGDKGYLSSEYQLNLFETSRIELNVPMRTNQHNYTKQPYVFRKSRKRIETLFSQLCDQFMIRRNYAKTFDGFRTRVLSKITALTTIQFINHFVLGRKINNIKINLS